MSMPEHVSARDITPKQSKFNPALIALAVAVGAIILFLVYYNISSLLPKSADQKYKNDRDTIELASYGFSTGYPGQRLSGGGYGRSASVGIVGLGGAGKGLRYGIWPSYAQSNRGTQAALKLEDITNNAITTLHVFESNPAGGSRGGTPSWEDVDGNGTRNASADVLYYGQASPPPEEDHWNTETIVEFDGEGQYVVDSRDWFIDISVLIEKEYMDFLPDSASPDNHPDGKGNYSWYFDENGQINSLLYTNPLKKGFQGTYP